MKPRLNTRIITDVITLDLRYFSRKKLIFFFKELSFVVEDRNNHFRKQYFNTEKGRPLTHPFPGVRKVNQNFNIYLKKQKLSSD